jgi:hypothetical protein
VILTFLAFCAAIFTFLISGIVYFFSILSSNIAFFLPLFNNNNNNNNFYISIAFITLLQLSVIRKLRSRHSAMVNNTGLDAASLFYEEFFRDIFLWTLPRFLVYMCKFRRWCESAVGPTVANSSGHGMRPGADPPGEKFVRACERSGNGRSPNVSSKCVRHCLNNSY